MTGWPIRLLQDELARHTYKPGYRLRIHDTLGHPQFELTLDTDDSRNPGRPIRLCFAAAVPAPLLFDSHGQVAVDAFTEWLARTLREFELHEADEWHRRDGNLVNDPHAPRIFGRPW